MDFSKKSRYSQNSWLLIVAAIIILATVNYLSVQNFMRFDLTENQRYTVSDATKNTLVNLEDIVTIKLFFSEKLPPQFVSLSQDVRDMLNEFEAYGNGNISVRSIDPAQDEETTNEVRALGIPEVKMNILEKDKYQVQTGYLGMGIFYADKQEIIPLIQSTSNLEYDLTAAIKKVTSERLKRIGFLAGHGEHGINDQLLPNDPNAANNDYTFLKKSLEKTYELAVVGTDNLSGVDTLIVAGPKTGLSDFETFQVDQFIMEGKNVIFLLESLNIEPGLQVAEFDHNLYEILNAYGIEPQKNLVLDAIHASAAFSQGFFQFMLPYPFWVKAVPENFHPENPIVAELDSLILTWVSPLVIEEKENIHYEVLASTSPMAFTKSAPYNLDPNQQFQAETQMSYPLVALARGKFLSAFTDKDIPAKEIPTEGEETVAAIPADISRTLQATSEANIVVIADADFLSDTTLSNYPQNLVFAQNVIDYLTLDKDLISIRSKKILDRPLKEGITETEKNVLRTIGIGLAPILLILYGAIRTMNRKKRKAAYLKKIFSDT